MQRTSNTRKNVSTLFEIHRRDRASDQSHELQIPAEGAQGSDFQGNVFETRKKTIQRLESPKRQRPCEETQERAVNEEKKRWASGTSNEGREVIVTRSVND